MADSDVWGMEVPNPKRHVFFVVVGAACLFWGYMNLFVVILVVLFMQLFRLGPFMPIAHKLTQITPKYTITGIVKPGFENVRIAYEKNLKMGHELTSQLVVHVDGEPVVDLTGSQGDKQYKGDSLQLVFSCTKNMTALAIAVAVDRGWIKYSDEICKHWPEFGTQKGKDKILVSDVMRHDAGLWTMDEGLSLDDLRCHTKLAKRMADETLHFDKVHCL